MPVEPRHQRRARAVVGLAVGRSPVDRGLRQGALAGRARAAARGGGATQRRAAVGLPRHGAARPGGLLASPAAAPAEPAWRGRAHGGRWRTTCSTRTCSRSASRAASPSTSARPCCCRSRSDWRGCSPIRRDRCSCSIAGKAHPRDERASSFVQQWAGFVRRTDVRARAVFLEDYDMALAENLVQGVDVWINTPRRPWEASGTSGMKVLVNGGLNLSELDGWWAEAYAPDVGWAIGDGREHDEPGWDAAETEQLYSVARTGGRAGVLRSRRRRHSPRLGRADPRQPVASHAALQQQPHAARSTSSTCTCRQPAASAAAPSTTCAWRASCDSGCTSCTIAGQASTGATSRSRPPRTGRPSACQVYLGELAPEYRPRRVVRRAAPGFACRARATAPRPCAQRFCRRIPVRRHRAQRPAGRRLHPAGGPRPCRGHGPGRDALHQLVPRLTPPP